MYPSFAPQCEEPVVRPTVNADIMSLLIHFTDEVWIFGGFSSNNKEGRSDVTIPKTFQDQGS
jgi:hypothetical protein